MSPRNGIRLRRWLVYVPQGKEKKQYTMMNKGLVNSQGSKYENQTTANILAKCCQGNITYDLIFFGYCINFPQEPDVRIRSPHCSAHR